MVSLYFHFFCLTADEVSVLSGMWIWVALTWAVSGRGARGELNPQTTVKSVAPLQFSCSSSPCCLSPMASDHRRQPLPRPLCQGCSQTFLSATRGCQAEAWRGAGLAWPPAQSLGALRINPHYFRLVITIGVNAVHKGQPPGRWSVCPLDIDKVTVPAACESNLDSQAGSPGRSPPLLTLSLPPGAQTAKGRGY